jgi:hypothetical protein
MKYPNPAIPNPNAIVFRVNVVLNMLFGPLLKNANKIVPAKDRRIPGLTKKKSAALVSRTLTVLHPARNGVVHP